MWCITNSHRGKRLVERVPEEWVAQLEQDVLYSQGYLDAVRELMAINVRLLALARAEHLVRHHGFITQ